MRTATQRSRKRGNAMLEFAIGFGLLLSVFSGVVQFGYAFYVYNTLETAVRNAARYGAVTQFNGPSGGGTGGFDERVQKMVLYGTPTPPPGATPVAPGLTTADIRVTVRQDVRGVPNRVTVGVDGYTLKAIFASYTLTNKPQVSFEYQGRYIAP